MVTDARPAQLPTVAEAQALILRTVPVLDAIEVPLAEALGAVLAEDVASDIDLPPFDASAMDGYAARAADVARVPVVLPVLEQIAAGRPPSRRVEARTCSEIMTGAMLPEGADAVVQVEHTERVSPGEVRFLRPVEKANIRRRGEDVRAGEVVLRAGAVIRPAEIGLLASVGRARVRTVRRPSVAVVATGDELVEVASKPLPGQIRNANGPALMALCGREGLRAVDGGVAGDRLDALVAAVRTGLQEDVLLVSAGVSVGEFDIVPRACAAVGGQVHLHGVRVKPGKPLLFGTVGRRVIHGREESPSSDADSEPCASEDAHSSVPRVVFGLPGNPVSTIVAFGLFVRPALLRMSGHADCLPERIPAQLRKPFRKRAGREQYEPAHLTNVAHLAPGVCGTGFQPVSHGQDGRATAWAPQPEVEALPTHGSGDLAALCRANALLVAPPSAEELPAGALVEVVRIL